MTVLEEENQYVVYYGNKKLTTLVPEYLDYEHFEKAIKIDVDGVEKEVHFGSLVEVKEYFNVIPQEGIRVNAIGYVNQKHSNESGLNIREKYFLKRFSIDKDSKRYRVEFYDSKEENKFFGMILVEFVGES
jgi:hypothetical protein